MSERYDEFMRKLEILLGEYQAEILITLNPKSYAIAEISFENPYEDYEMPSYLYDGMTKVVKKEE